MEALVKKVKLGLRENEECSLQVREEYPCPWMSLPDMSQNNYALL
jgi:hypothetical protein